MEELELPIKSYLLGGQTVRYYQSGNNPTVLLLHGFGIGADIWHLCYTYLAQEVSFIVLDLPGYGLNQNFESDPHVDACTEFVRESITLFDSVAYLVGYSFSTRVALHIAQNPPAQLRKVICIATPIFESKHIKHTGTLFSIIGSNALLASSVMHARPLKELVYYVKGLGSIRRRKTMKMSMEMLGQKSDNQHIFSSLATLFRPYEHVTITIPIDFIYGELDGFATPEMSKSLSKTCTHSHLYEVKGAYHLLPLEKPQEVAELILHSIRN